MLRFKQFLIEYALQSPADKARRRQQDKIAREAPLDFTTIAFEIPQPKTDENKTEEQIKAEKLEIERKAQEKRTRDLDEYGVDLEELKREIKERESKGNEKKVTGVYADPDTLLTLGHGHLIFDQTPKIMGEVFAEEIKLKPDFVDLVLKQGYRLTESQMDRLLERDVRSRLDPMTQTISRFKEYDPEVKGAMSSEWYRGLLPQSKKTIRLLNAGKFAEAAEEYKKSRDYTGFTDANGKFNPPLPGVVARIDHLVQALKKQKPLPVPKIPATPPIAVPQDEEDINK